MQDNNQVQTPVTPVIKPQVVVDQPKQSNLLIILLSVLLLLSVLVAGFFAYQTQKLVKELQGIRNEELITTKITPEPTTEPVATNSASATADPTANWKTYMADGYSFSFKYPADFKVEVRVPGFYVISTKNESVAQAGVSIDARLLGPYSSLVDSRKVIIDSLKISETTKVSGWEVFQGVGKDGMLKGVEFRQAIISYKTGAIEAETLANTDYVKIFDQILSTFKFTN